MQRPDWDHYFLDIALAVSARATCHRAQIGAVAVDDNHHILTVGYNGVPPGAPHCPADESLVPDDHCTRSIHAEQNAIAHSKVSLAGATWYLSGGLPPCDSCALLLKASGAKEIHWK